MVLFYRLGLERSSTAREAVDVITNLLQKYGQENIPTYLVNNKY